MNSSGNSHKCTQCDYVTTNVGNFKRHSIIHKGEKQHKCNLCNFASAHAVSLRLHMVGHSGEKPNKCSQCDYKCANPSSLWRHFKKHAGDKSFKCNQCDYVSNQSILLKSHLKIHGGEKTKTLPKALRTQALTALTSNFCSVGFVQYAVRLHMNLQIICFKRCISTLVAIMCFYSVPLYMFC